MGWTYQSRSRGLSHREFFSQELEHGSAKVLDVAAYLDVAYIAYQVPKGTTAVVVLMNWVREPGDGQNFGYKEMDETMGPGPVACPARILDQLSSIEALYGSSTTGATARAWREACRATLAERAVRPKVSGGQKVMFDPPLEFADGSRQGEFRFLKGSRFRGLDGRTYHITSWRTRRYSVETEPAPSSDPEPYTDLQRGDWVWVEGRKGRFVSYGDPRHACGPNHISYPGSRIVFVDFGRPRSDSAWEHTVSTVAPELVPEPLARTVR